MSLNIKNERVHDLVREAAAITGQSQTSVVETALRRFLDEIEAERSREESERRHATEMILKDLQDSIAAAGGLQMEIEDLYDENGLPA